MMYNICEEKRKVKRSFRGNMYFRTGGGNLTMQFSVGVEYAFHSLFYLIDLPEHKAIGIRDIAKLHGITETYLSKIFAKLRKAGIVQSIAGAHGGYALAKKAEEISFWDIIEALEGTSHFFRCAEIRKKNIFVTNPRIYTDKCPCLIKVVIHEAEDLMRDKLRNKSLHWLYEQVYKDFSTEKKKEITRWIKDV
jgi:Rrf2 family protein